MIDSSIVAYIDGGARGNPGPAGYGVRIERTDGALVEELREAIGMATNNVAEYRGLIAALTYLLEHGHRRVDVRSDSELLVKQMRGEYKVRHPALQALHLQARMLLAGFERVRFEHVARAQNAEADRLANLAMDEAEPPLVDSPARPRSAARQPRGEPRSPVPTPTPSPSAAPPDRVVGIGLDAEDVRRVADLLDRFGDRFLTRVFTDGEIAYSRKRRHPAQHLAGRFAAKEAAMKALGTGHAHGVLWRDIEVVRSDGPPEVRFHGEAGRRFTALGGRRALVTITHTDTTALAQVVILGS